MTPMMEQYFEVKNQYKDYLLFYRLGDFYELFFDDALTASRVLELTLTGRDCGETERAPMCGVPFHAADVYIGKLIEKGYKVAVCEQMEDPALAKGLVKREVIRVVTPGTVIETSLLPEQKNNYICSLYVGNAGTAVCFSDISTANMIVTVLDNGDGHTDSRDVDARVINELATYLPRELITNQPPASLSGIMEWANGHGVIFSGVGVSKYDFAACRDLVARQFAKQYGECLPDSEPLICAVGALLDYLHETQKSDLSYIDELTVYTDAQYLGLDVNTRRNLELTEAMRTGEKKGTLLWVLDRTKTSPGARMLRRWVENPLMSPVAIARRQTAVAELCDDYMGREELGVSLSRVLDLERLMTKIEFGTANAKDLRAVGNTVAVIPEIIGALGQYTCRELCDIRDGIDALEDVQQTVSSAIAEDPPFSVRDGGMIAPGYNAEVDTLRSMIEDGKGWVERVAAEEKERTGIKTLKVGYNKVFGYYIEVSKSFVPMVPENYIRKQTLVGAERYITQELKETEAKILGAKDSICSLEYELFCQVRNFVAEQSARIRKTAECLARLDVLRSLACVATENRYVCPEVTTDNVIDIRDGRHPVVELFVKDSYFVPNDIHIDTGDNRLMLITGPNMAGKSTYMRQVALIVLMAQIGSFVPAASAHIGIVDRIFTRVGASDDLASGQSTFMLEMNEVAYILHNATKKSLIVYDEVGRGTSTFDGMSIAKAIIEYTAGRRIGARTLFATHYHELTSMEGQCPGVVNYHIAARKRGDTVTFLRKIVKGSTDDSFGIEVAKLAGIPSEVVKRAKEVLREVEKASSVIRDIGKEEGNEPERREDDTIMSIDDCLNQSLVDSLREIDINTLSPYECMNLLFEWKKQIR